MIDALLQDWHNKVAVTAGYLSADGRIEAEVGYNETDARWEWKVVDHDLTDDSGTIKILGGIGTDAADCQRQADHAISQFEKWIGGGA